VSSSVTSYVDLALPSGDKERINAVTTLLLSPSCEPVQDTECKLSGHIENRSLREIICAGTAGKIEGVTQSEASGNWQEIRHY